MERKGNKDVATIGYNYQGDERTFRYDVTSIDDEVMVIRGDGSDKLSLTVGYDSFLIVRTAIREQSGSLEDARYLVEDIPIGDEDVEDEITSLFEFLEQ